MNRPLFAVLVVAASLPVLASQPPGDEAPKAHDDRLVVELVAAAPDIVHPVALDFDAKGRLLVIESHTHFRPQNYKGPKHDRIRVVEDTDGDGKADHFTTFFEGTVATMDLATHPDGPVYLATRNEILRLRDTDGDGTADEKLRVVFLDTKGDYPHNGLSGLCFDSKGNLLFGMGENLGAFYKLVGSDGTTIVGEGDGGHIYWCTADGKGLRRVATGFWNPFGVCRDIYGRVFAVDNDPDAMPPCRLLHVVEGGDYGYQFRYGRSGRHPFQAWNGELPGTLPMVSGTGEAPCEVLSYESDGLPGEYLGSLLVTSWADHRVERYVLKPKGASFVADRKPFVQGGKDFRPTGMAVAPDGSLYFSDWVLRDYNLHGRGAIWRLRMKDPPTAKRPADPAQALLSLHRPAREAAARQLAAKEPDAVRKALASKDARARAAALTALLDAGTDVDLQRIVSGDADPGMRSLAVRALAAAEGDVRAALSDPALKREAMPSLRTKADVPRLLDLVVDADPFVRHAAIQQLAKTPALLDAIDVTAEKDPRRRAALLLAHRNSGRPEARRLLPTFVADADDDVRLLAARWVADQKLTEQRRHVDAVLKDPALNVRLYWAYSTALARLDGQDVNEGRLADLFMGRVADDRAAAAVRALALQLVPAKHGKLTVDVLAALLAQPDVSLQREAVRALAEHPSPKRTATLLDVARNDRLSDDVRAHAIAGLADRAAEHRDALLPFATGDRPRLRDEALRALVETKLTAEQSVRLEEVAGRHPEARDLVARVLGRPFTRDRPPANDVDRWLARLDGPADAEAGRRVFAHPRLGACARCHRGEGRGNVVGPDLSTIGRTERRRIVESVLQPSNNVAPHYQVWVLETADGKVRTGLLTHTHYDESTYLDENGNTFTLHSRDVVSAQTASRSLMPDGLADRLTEQELRDLFAYLQSRR